MNNSDKSSILTETEKEKIRTICEIVLNIHEKIKPEIGYEILDEAPCDLWAKAKGNERALANRMPGEDYHTADE